MALAITVHELKPGCKLMRMEGDIGNTALAEFEQGLQEIAESKPKALLVDLSEVGFICSGAVGVLLAANAAVSDQLVLVGPRGHVEASLHLIGALALLRVAPTEEEALKMLEETPGAN